MQILNSKAYYLNSHALKRRNKTQNQTSQTNSPDNRANQANNKSSKSPMNTLEVPPVNSKNNNSLRTKKPSISSNSTVHLSTVSAPKTKPLSLADKEKSLLQKVIDQKAKEIKEKRSYTVETGKSRVLLEAHPLGSIDSIELKSMKPTDRYFHKLENVKIAQKLLLARASDECNRRTLSKFFRQQRQYKANISKLHYLSKKEQETSRLKLLNRRKWTH